MEKNDKRKKELDYELKELERKDVEHKLNMKQHILDSEDITKSINVKKNEINKFKQNLKDYEDKIPEFEEKCNKNKAEVEEAKEEFDKIEAQMQSRIAKPKAELQKLEEERGKLKLIMQKEENEIQRMKDMSQENDIKRLLSEIKNAEGMIEHEHINMRELEKDYQKMCEQPGLSNERKVKEAKETLENLSNEKIEIQQKLSEILNEIEEMNNGSGGNDNQQHMLEILKKAYNEGVLSGIRGRLGDLGTIDPKFDIAIST